MNLITTPNLPDPDAAYATLLAVHKGLSEAQSHAFNARLILILMNHLGGGEVWTEALNLARDE